MNELLNRRARQSFPVTDFMSTLQSVQINPTEICNRTCSFCPRSDPALYKNSKDYISIEMCELIAKQLSLFKFIGRIGFVGFGEPLLHPNIVECIRTIRQHCQSAQCIEINTNGDVITRSMIQDLKDAGCTDIAISMYDRDESEKYDNMFLGIDIRYTLRHHYNSADNYNLIMVDRIGILKNEKKDINSPCYIPFYKLFIDWNGDYLLCDQDWGKTTNQFNIANIDISDFWMTKLTEYRNHLILGNRSACDLCNKCNVVGTLHGSESFNFIASLTAPT